MRYNSISVRVSGPPSQMLDVILAPDRRIRERVSVVRAVSYGIRLLPLVAKVYVVVGLKESYHI